MYLDEVKTLFAELRIAEPSALKPCTEEEISTIEEKLERPLPKAYNEFLLWMGHGAGRFQAGTQCFYQDLSNIQEWAHGLLEENNFPESLPDDAFTFLMHQGYQFMFFRLSEGEDPAVYYYHEAMHKTTFEKKFGSFSEYLKVAVESYAQ